MIDKRKLIDLFRQMYDEHWSYEWGAARKGCVDCSGAFVYAYMQFGESIYHGSNKIARKHCGQMLPISQAKPGMAAFKKRVPGDSRYALPAAYQKGGADYNGDLNDYYHIGLVDDNTGYVLNAQSTSTGFVRSPIGQNWCGVAYLNKVNYGGDVPVEALYQAKVYGDNMKDGTKTVHVRSTPSTKGKIVTDLNIGDVVDVFEEADGWSHIEHDGDVGYMMSKFLKKVDEDGDDTAVDTGDRGCGVCGDLEGLMEKVDRTNELLAMILAELRGGDGKTFTDEEGVG